MRWENSKFNQENEVIVENFANLLFQEAFCTAVGWDALDQ